MMLKFLIPVVLSTALAGCFISDAPMIGPGKAVFPYEKISYKEESGDDVLTMIHQGDAYVATGRDADANVAIRFMPVSDGLYLVEVKGTGDGSDKPTYLHAVIALDADKKTARSYAAVGQDPDKPAPAGMHKCGDDLCLDALDAYLSYAQTVITARQDPDATYTIVEMK